MPHIPKVHESFLNARTSSARGNPSQHHISSTNLRHNQIYLGTWLNASFEYEIASNLSIQRHSSFTSLRRPSQPSLQIHSEPTTTCLFREHLPVLISTLRFVASLRRLLSGTFTLSDVKNIENANSVLLYRPFQREIICAALEGDVFVQAVGIFGSGLLLLASVYRMKILSRTPGYVLW